MVGFCLRTLLACVLACAFLPNPVFSAELPVTSVSDTTLTAPPAAPVTSLVVVDHEYDNGGAVELSWVPSIDDQLLKGRITGYRLFRSANGGPGEMITELPAGSNSYLDNRVSLDSSYVYYVETISDASPSASIRTESITPEREWINFNRKYLFLIGLIISMAVIFFIETARRGTKLFIRRIAGLEAVDEAIGRATEMGRPILFIPGIQDMDDVQTIAGITILGRVSRVIADYDTKINMPVSRSLVMTAARETIKTSYMAAGRPDAYNDDMVSYVTDEQFGYVAAVDGIMVREKPAACFYLGAFFAESLIIAETGNSIGAIQIAGTAMPAQLPFFVAACDFTLIGEELFAASAYLSGEPKQLGSLKGQDVGKAIALAAILLGVAGATLTAVWNVELVSEFLKLLTTIFKTN